MPDFPIDYDNNPKQPRFPVGTRMRVVSDAVTDKATYSSQSAKNRAGAVEAHEWSDAFESWVYRLRLEALPGTLPHSGINCAQSFLVRQSPENPEQLLAVDTADSGTFATLMASVLGVGR